MFGIQWCYYSILSYANCSSKCIIIDLFLPIFEFLFKQIWECRVPTTINRIRMNGVVMSNGSWLMAYILGLLYLHSIGFIYGMWICVYCALSEQRWFILIKSKLSIHFEFDFNAHSEQYMQSEKYGKWYVLIFIIRVSSVHLISNTQYCSNNVNI